MRWMERGVVVGRLLMTLDEILVWAGLDLPIRLVYLICGSASYRLGV